MSHAKAQLTPAGRLLLVRRVLDEGWPAAHAAAMAGVSRQTVHKWLGRFANEGVDGLEDRSSRAHRCPHRTAPEVEARVLELRSQLRRGPHRLSDRTGLPASTIHAILARHGLSRLSRLDRTTGQVIRRAPAQRYERARPGELVHLDVKKLGRVPEGGGWRAHGREAGRVGKQRRPGYDYLHVAIDDFSRFAYVEVLADERGETCAGFFARTREHLAHVGVSVEAVMTDNAKNYTLAKVFKAALGSARHLTTRPYRPQTNGKAERFNRTLADEWAYDPPYRSNDERTAALAAFVIDYNYTRTHSGIGHKPPASRLP
ncbi:MAG: IS481 family transposase [Acidimicrobiales bacterium]